jgi:hypothetical protein
MNDMGGAGLLTLRERIFARSAMSRENVLVGCEEMSNEGLELPMCTSRLSSPDESAAAGAREEGPMEIEGGSVIALIALATAAAPLYAGRGRGRADERELAVFGANEDMDVSVDFEAFSVVKYDILSVVPASAATGECNSEILVPDEIKNLPVS